MPAERRTARMLAGLCADVCAQLRPAVWWSRLHSGMPTPGAEPAWRGSPPGPGSELLLEWSCVHAVRCRRETLRAAGCPLYCQGSPTPSRNATGFCSTILSFLLRKKFKKNFFFRLKRVHFLLCVHVRRLHIGIGRAELSRPEIFRSSSGLAVTMLERVFCLPGCSGG